MIANNTEFTFNFIELKDLIKEICHEDGLQCEMKLEMNLRQRLESDAITGKVSISKDTIKDFLKKEGIWDKMKNDKQSGWYNIAPFTMIDILTKFGKKFK